jgi:hypothetical protein
MATEFVRQLWNDLWFGKADKELPYIRLELGGEEYGNIEQGVPRFLQAHRRACAVADHLFERECRAVIAWHTQTKPDPDQFPNTNNGFDALAASGFSANHSETWQAELFPDPEEGQAWELRGYDLGRDKIARDTLLWHAIALEMPISPSAPVLSFLIAPAKSLMLHVYDDRGLDITATDPEVLRASHVLFDPWLLDYDRERMEQIFHLSGP